jgi:threonyl-tRNA synthetase
VAADHAEYAESVAASLRSAGFRVELIDAVEPLGARIRRGKLEKVPYVLVVGGDDVAAGTAGVNDRAGNVERGVPVAAFAERLRSEAAARA